MSESWGKNYAEFKIKRTLAQHTVTFVQIN